MRILYDGMIYSLQRAGGINRYFADLIDRLPDDCIPTLMTTARRGLNSPVHPRLRRRFYRPFRLAGLSRLAETQFFRAVEARERFDVAHPTYYSLLSRREVRDYRCPVVLTVYDMIHELFLDQLPSHQQQVPEQKRKAVLAAQAVLCISENTKRDLLNHYPVDEEKITVIPLAADLDASMSYGPQSVPERPYFLYVGSRGTYKNFDRLLRAFVRVASQNSDLALCVVGSGFTDTERAEIADSGLTERISHFGHVDDAHLAKLYRCSLAFVYPSLYEGFGIPPLEAMACGTLVIAADCSSIPEVVGDAGLLFDPYSVDALTDRLVAVADGTVPRDEFLERGRRQAAGFSWKRTAEQTVAVYRTLASG